MDYNVEVRLLAITPNSEYLLEQAGRICYASVEKLGTNEKWLQTRISQGHESLLEHAVATFYIKASRALTHELVRHRIASYSQRSQRYVKEINEDYIAPPELSSETNPDAGQLFQQAMLEAWKTYRQLLAKGIQPELARYVLPNACATEIICTWNFREIRHIIKLRSTQQALPEFQAVAEKIKGIMKLKAPNIFVDL